MMANANIDKEFESLARHLNAIKVPVVLVSNEGWPVRVVPMDAMSREFVDHAGRLHQLLAEICGNVWYLNGGPAATVEIDLEQYSWTLQKFQQQ